MTNHIHLIAVPETEDRMAKAIGRAHQHYTRGINFRQERRGYLFQGRFYSRVMDEPYILAAVAYGGWPTSFRGRGHDDPHRAVSPDRIIQPPPSKKVGHPPYVEPNPVRTGMCALAWESPWSSARFHVGLWKTDALVRERDLPGMESRWRSHPSSGAEHADFLRKKTRTGSPCGDEAFVHKIESQTGRNLTPNKPGPRPKKRQQRQR